MSGSWFIKTHQARLRAFGRKRVDAGQKLERVGAQERQVDLTNKGSVQGTLLIMEEHTNRLNQGRPGEGLPVGPCRLLWQGADHPNYLRVWYAYEQQPFDCSLRREAQDYVRDRKRGCAPAGLSSSNSAIV